LALLQPNLTDLSSGRQRSVGDQSSHFPDA